MYFAVSSHCSVFISAFVPRVSSFFLRCFSPLLSILPSCSSLFHFVQFFYTSYKLFMTNSISVFVHISVLFHFTLNQLSYSTLANVSLLLSYTYFEFLLLHCVLLLNCLDTCLQFLYGSDSFFLSLVNFLFLHF